MTVNDQPRPYSDEERARQSLDVARFVATIVERHLIVDEALGPEEARRLSERVVGGLVAALDTAGAAGESPVTARSDAAPPALSRREQELLTHVAQGLTDTQIADRLFISVHTVGSHLDRIRAKTGCRRRAELTRLALRLQLGPPAA